MILATHAIVGASVASIVPHHPVAGFVFGFLSHFAIDAIPHWDYFLSSMRRDPDNYLNNDMRFDKHFPFDLVKIGLDAFLGIALALLFFQQLHQPLQWSILFGMFGGMLPDALQFVYWKFRREPLRTLQRFHLWIHAKKKLDHQPFLGILFQIIFASVCILLAKWVIVFLG